jgi:acyl carrier protein
MENIRNKIIELIFSAINEVNQQLPPENRLLKNEESVIAGEDGKFDSLAFLNLIVSVEGRVDTALRTSVALASGLMELDRTPPRTVGELADFIIARLEIIGHG